jgi:hypothetical protein
VTHDYRFRFYARGLALITGLPLVAVYLGNLAIHDHRHRKDHR